MYLKSITIQVTIVVFATIICQSKQYDMTVVKRNPKATTTPSPETVRQEILDFESRRSATFTTVEGRITIVDADNLCSIIENDVDMMKGLQGKRMFHFIPVMPAEGYGLPAFTNPCYGWTRKKCTGTPKPPFDYRCHFWTPYFSFAGSQLCVEGQVPEEDENARRKKRDAPFDPIVVNGLEAATLCATIGQIDPTMTTFPLEAIALPTNEGSKLRCVTWSLSVEGDWEKDKLSIEACKMLNKRRPSGYVVSEVSNGVIEELFTEIVGCESKDKLVNCYFAKDNIHDDD